MVFFAKATAAGHRIGARMTEAPEPAMLRYARVLGSMRAAGARTPRDRDVRFLRRFWLRSYTDSQDGAANPCAFEALGFTYLFDDALPSQPQEPRVIAAFGRARASQPGAALLARILEERSSGTPARASVDRFEREMHFQFEANSKRVLARLDRGMVGALGHFRRGIAELSRQVLADYPGLRLSEKVRTELEALANTLGDGPTGNVAGALRQLRPLQRLEATDLEPCVRLADEAERSTTWPATRPIRRALLETLRRRAFRDLLRELRKPGTPDDNERIQRRLGPVLAELKARPRSEKIQRRFRFLPEGTGLGDEYDVGHLVAHAAGGSTDVNYFAQRRSLNQGRSGAGRRYRWMERIASTGGDAVRFFFSRLIYRDDTALPTALEYGVLVTDDRAAQLRRDHRFAGPMWLVAPAASAADKTPLSWWIGRFDNRADQD